MVGQRGTMSGGCSSSQTYMERIGAVDMEHEQDGIGDRGLAGAASARHELLGRRHLLQAESSPAIQPTLSLGGKLSKRRLQLSDCNKSPLFSSPFPIPLPTDG